MLLQRTMRAVVVAFAAAAALAGCGDDEETNPPAPVTLEVSATDLEPLDAGHYEAWIAFPLPDDEKRPADGGAVPLHGDLELISIGKFQMAAGNVIEGLDGGAPVFELRADRDPSFAAEGWISIEPEGDQDTIPAGLLLAGPFVGTTSRGTATLDASYRSIWDLELANLDLNSLEGTFTLETPSDESGSNEALGLFWRILPDSAGLETLPALDGERLSYEGWIERPVGGVVSTGRFTSADTLDSDAAGAGVLVVEATPRYPGQEFTAATVETLNAGGYSAFITLEPTDDNDPARPTQFMLLSQTIGTGAGTGSSIEMTNTTADLPTAFIAINR